MLGGMGGGTPGRPAKPLRTEQREDEVSRKTEMFNMRQSKTLPSVPSPRVVVSRLCFPPSNLWLVTC